MSMKFRKNVNKHKNPGNIMFPGIRVYKNYLFENCGARRAAFKPYFFFSIKKYPHITSVCNYSRKK